MKVRHLLCFTALTLFCSISTLSAAEWTPLFNGKNLEGWNNPYEWGEAKVVDGEIHLSASKKFFLVTEKTYGDFVLEGDVSSP